MAKHSKIGASSYSRWGACPGSVKLSENMPNTSSSFALEGTKAHDLAEKILTNQDVSDIDYDEEMADAVQVYVSYIQNLAIDAEYLGVEERFALRSLHPDLFGTSDATVYKDKILYVVDYKHGAGLAVEIENNKQLQFYALGALMKLGVPCSHVEMVIVQPRAFHADGPIRKWRIPVIDLIEFGADLKDDAYKTEDPNAIIVSGDHCRFCPAAPICPELHSTALETAKIEFAPTLSYDPEQLADVLTKLPAIKAWTKAVEDFAFREAEAGRIPPGQKLVPKRAMRKWADEAEAQSYLLNGDFDLAPTDIVTEKIKSPAQVEKLLAKDKKAKLNEIVIKQSSGNKLVPVADKRKAEKPAIEVEFTKIEN